MKPLRNLGACGEGVVGRATEGFLCPDWEIYCKRQFPVKCDTIMTNDKTDKTCFYKRVLLKGIGGVTVYVQQVHLEAHTCNSSIWEAKIWVQGQPDLNPETTKVGDGWTISSTERTIVFAFSLEKPPTGVTSIVLFLFLLSHCLCAGHTR